MDIEPTFKGYIEDEDDALLILQATLDGKLKHIPRRPYEIERPYLIVSGSIFVFIEEISGIKRWTDGVSWSPSRISGKFLIYKELDKDNANANANANGSSDPAIISDGHSDAKNPSSSKIKLPPLKNHQFDLPPTMAHSNFESDQDSSISPSNRSNLPLKYTGLVKKTISVKLKRPPFNSIENLHIVSYYSVKDIKQNRLVTPKSSPFLKDIRPSQDLIIAMENTTLGNVKNNTNTTNANNPNSINNKSNSSTPLNTVISTNNNSANINAAGGNQFTSANKNYYYKNDESSGYPIAQFAPALPSTTLMYTTNPPYITQSPDNANATGMNTHSNNNINNNNNNNNNTNNNNNNNTINNNTNNSNTSNINAGNNNSSRFTNGSFAYNSAGDFINSQQQGQISYPFYYTTIPINNPNYYTTQPPNPAANNTPMNDNHNYSTSSTQHPYYGHPIESQLALTTAGTVSAPGAPGTAENGLPVSNMQPVLHQANNNNSNAASTSATAAGPSATPYPVYSMNVPYYSSPASAFKRAQDNTISNPNAETSASTNAPNPAYTNSQQYTTSQVYYQGFPQYAMASAQNSSMYQHQHQHQHQHPLPTVYPITASQQNIINSSHASNTIGSDPQHHHYQQEPNDHKNFTMGHSNSNILNITNNDTMNNINTNTSTTTQ
ncbi:hypothetical protein SUVZ_05G0640 [Saccharomyces uvarum]|uniref:Uncharacterized protein n=1 Tax=Saccharomyces uvarum TaxID=230603 RepID=A0ABN8WVU9_SACUV|nr:hypothetical protein SUVZ_05G0640 [Saccharomyces uvarum]